MRILLVTATLLLALAPFGAAQDPEPIPESGDIAPGGTYSYTFTEEYVKGHTYHCHPHPWMWAMVHVNADKDGETTTHHVTISDNGDITDQANMTYTEQHLSIEVGDTVIWTNEGTFTHTVSPGDPNGEEHEHTEHSHNDDHLDDHPGDETGTPGFGLIAAIGALAGAAFIRRR